MLGDDAGAHALGRSVRDGAAAGPLTTIDAAPGPISAYAAAADLRVSLLGVGTGAVTPFPLGTGAVVVASIDGAGTLRLRLSAN